MVSESRKRELSAGVKASIKLRASSRHVVVGGDSVYEGEDAGLHQGHDDEVKARIAAVRAAKLRKKREAEAEGEQSEQLNRTELEEILPGEVGRTVAWPGPPRKATPEVIAEVMRMRSEGHSGSVIGERLGISKTLANRIVGART